MRKLTIIATCTFVALTVIWSLLRLTVEPAVDAKWIKGIYAKKEAVAAKVEGPKIVIVGGSASHFSFSAGDVSRKTGLPVINLGTHAGLGIDYLLDRARQSLAPGDTALLSIEYSLPGHTGINATVASQVAYNDLTYVLQARLQDKLALLFGIGPVQLFRAQVTNLLPRNPGHYHAASVNEHGDETANESVPVSPSRVEDLRSQGGPFGLNFRPSQAHPALVRFVNWTSARGIVVLYVPPPLFIPEQYRELDSTKVNFALMDAYYRRAGVTPIGTGSDYIMDAEDLFDTVKHANGTGRAKMSAQLAADLCRAVACPRR